MYLTFWAFANKSGGKVTTSGKIVVAADGKSRTVTVSGTDSSGKTVSYLNWQFPRNNPSK